MIKDLNELQKLFKLCRKQGIMEIELGDIKFKLGDLPRDNSSTYIEEPKNPYENFPDGELTPEQLMFYSAGGLPEDDPYLKGN